MNRLPWIVMTACVACGCGGAVADRPGEPTPVEPAASPAARTPDASANAPPRAATDASVIDFRNEPPLPVAPQSEFERIERGYRAAEARWEELLRKRIDVDLTDVPLPDALAEFARRAGAPSITIDEIALAEEGIDVDLPITLTEKRITLGQTLWRILEPFGLTWRYIDGALHVTTQVKAGELLSAKTYSIAHLRRALEASPGERVRARIMHDLGAAIRDADPVGDSLADLLVNATSGPWMESDDTGGTARFLGPLVTVRQTRSCQDEVAWLLHALDQFAREGFRAGSVAYEPPWVPPVAPREIEAALDRPAARVAWKETPLRGVFRAFARDYGLPIFVDEEAMREEGILPNLPVTLAAEGHTVRSVLKQVLEPIGMAAVSRYGFLWLTSSVRADERLRTIVYDVRDILERVANQYGPFVELITQETQGPWQDIDGTGGTIDLLLGGCCVVRQTEACHDDIAALLASLRGKLREQLPVAGAEPIRDPPTFADADGLDLRIYPLRSAALAASLAGCFLDISPESWSARGGKGSIHAVDTALAVRQTRAVHARIVRFLTDMRRAGVAIDP